MANPSVTYTFSNGTTADATQINTNYTDLINALTDGTKSLSIDALTCAGAVTLNGNVTLGNASVDDIVFTGSINSHLTFKTTFDFDIGSSTVGARSVYLGSNDDAARSVRLIAGVVGTSYTFTFPTSAGTSGYVLTTNGSGVTSWRAGAGKMVYRSVITTDAPTSSDDVLGCSGASFTITLPDASAAANTNKVFEILHLGTSLTQVYTLNTTSAQTIGGIASGAYALYTNGERLKIVSDGSNWQILDHYAKTLLATYTPSNKQGFGTTTNDDFLWARDGQFIEIMASFTAGTVAGSEAQIELPNSSAVSSLITGIKMVGGWIKGVAATQHGGSVLATAADTFLNFSDDSIYGDGSATGTTPVNGNVMLANSDPVAFTVRVPISGWRP
jgi:hypothetical protein